MIAADVQGSLECGAFQGISQIIFKAAVECQIILPDIHSRFTQLQDDTRESKYRLLNIYRRQCVSEPVSSDWTEKLPSACICSKYSSTVEPARVPGLPARVRSLHVVQRIDLLHLYQIQLPAGGQWKSESLTAFHRCIQTERIACQYEIKRSYRIFSSIPTGLPLRPEQNVKHFPPRRVKKDNGTSHSSRQDSPQTEEPWYFLPSFPGKTF